MVLIELTDVSGNTVYVNMDKIVCIADYGLIIDGYDGVLKVKEDGNVTIDGQNHGITSSRDSTGH